MDNLQFCNFFIKSYYRVYNIFCFILLSGFIQQFEIFKELILGI